MTDKAKALEMSECEVFQKYRRLPKRARKVVAAIIERLTEKDS
jgi:hypothetical protein